MSTTVTCARGISATVDPSAGSPHKLAILVLAPYLTFDDLSPAATPALWRLAQSGAVGAMNARTADRGQPNAASGALTISASRWASVSIDAAASAADVVALQAANDAALTRPTLGSLGTAVHEQGGQTGAVSTGITPVLATVPRAQRRPAELAAMDVSGTIDARAWDMRKARMRGRNPLYADIPIPFAIGGPSAILQLVDSGGPGLLVVDSPALMLAGESTTMTPTQATRAHRAAVAELDAAVAILRDAAPADAFFLVVAPATEELPSEDPVMGPVIAAGRGLSGTLTSPSTHRDGIITNLDVAPTLLDALDLKRPVVMVGSASTARASSLPLENRLAALSAADRSSGAIDRLREAWFIRGLVALSLVASGLAVWVVRARERLSGSALAQKVADLLLLSICAILPSAWLMFLVQRQPLSVASAGAAFATAVVLVMVLLVGVRRLASRCSTARPQLPVLVAPFAASVLTTVVILAEQWLGAPMRSGLLSYSVRSGWRYYGMGNEGAAVVVSASIVAVGLGVDLLGDTRAGRAVRRFALPVIGTTVLVTAAAPFAGANAGVAVWGVIAYGVAWSAMNHLRLTAPTVAVIALTVAAVVVAFAAIDLSAGVAAGTHLARFASGVVSGDVSSTSEMVGRKLANNLGYFVATTYTLLFLGMGGIFALLRRGSASGLRRAIEPLPALRAALLGVFVGGLVALVSEDSSSVMPALMWIAALAPTLTIALALPAPVSAPDAT